MIAWNLFGDQERGGLLTVPKDGALRPQWIIFMKAAIKGKWGLLRKLEGTQPWLLAML